jgi:sugar lactone lactonase YvrE
LQDVTSLFTSACSSSRRVPSLETFFVFRTENYFCRSILVTLLHGTNVALTPFSRWSPNGTTVSGGHGEGKELNQLWNPLGLYVHDDQTVYVADHYNHRIMAWSSGAKQGQVVAGGHGEGNGLTQLNWPKDVIVDRSTDTLLICDGSNSRVVRWPRRDGKRGEILLSNIACWGLMIDDRGFLYISDRDKHEVRRFRMDGDLQGRVVVGGKDQGDATNQLNSPQYLFVDRNYSVYVSEKNNHRVMKWVEDAREGLVVAGGHEQGNDAQQLTDPCGVLVDDMGTVYVAERTNHRVMRWVRGADEGSVVVGVHDWGNAANQLNGPVGLSFDRDGHLYVVDQENNRVQKFELLSK